MRIEHFGRVSSALICREYVGGGSRGDAAFRRAGSIPLTASLAPVGGYGGSAVSQA